jgi:hypothetical protein
MVNIFTSLAQRFIMEWYPGVPGQVERILSQLPNLKTLVVISNGSCELGTLDMDSLRLRCALDATAMEISTLNEWFRFRRAFGATMNRMKPILDRYNKTRGVDSQAEMTVMGLYNCWD